MNNINNTEVLTLLNELKNDINGLVLANAELSNTVAQIQCDLKDTDESLKGHIEMYNGHIRALHT